MGKNIINLSAQVDLKDLSSLDPKVKYGCAKKLVTIATKTPAKIYPHIDFFIDLLDSSNQILKWTAIDVIGHLSRVDKKKKVNRLLSRLCALLNAGKLITAAHSISAISEIALAQPRFQAGIIKELLRVERYNYDTVECRNIALGKVILALDSFYDNMSVKEKQKTREFVKRQTTNSRHATRKKAEEFLKKIMKAHS